MNHFKAHTLVGLIGQFENTIGGLSVIADLLPPGQPPIEVDYTNAIKLFESARKECGDIRLTDSLRQIGLATPYISRPLDQLTASEVRSELNRVKETIIKELSERKFLFIPKELTLFLDSDALFGHAVAQVFPSGKEDIRESGNCLAADCNTACVFHLMRVGEHGLRRLARKLRVRLTHTGKNCPIEFADWDKVVTAIRGKIAEARKKPSRPKRQALLEAYSNAADHCEYMKDIWRNNMAHTRNPYSASEAIVVFGRLQDFMQFLGRYLSP